MTDSVRPHRRQPTRLPRPWDSPGKNTGVGCHFLLQCMEVKSESEVAQLCPTPNHPMGCSLPASSVHEIFQARVLEWRAIAFSFLNSRLTYNCLMTSPYACQPSIFHGTDPILHSSLSHKLPPCSALLLTQFVSDSL